MSNICTKASMQIGESKLIKFLINTTNMIWLQLNNYKRDLAIK